MSSNLQKGNIGEQMAVSFLQEKGHQIIYTNYRWEKKEIDIISLDKDVLVFTEVKTRTSFVFGYPEAAVDIKKQNYIKAVADAFIESNPEYLQLRFDIIAIILNQNKIEEIVHWEDAFY